MHNGTLMVSGGSYNFFSGGKKCYELKNGTWKNHSTLNFDRFHATTVFSSASETTFVFGGSDHSKSPYIYEYLAKDSTVWQVGKKRIPEGFVVGSAVEIKSKHEIWLIGGNTSKSRILIFDTNNHTFRKFPSTLKKGRYGHACALIPGDSNKIMVTGGIHQNSPITSVEIIDIENGSVVEVNPMVSRRSGHAIGVIKVKNEEKIVVFGGLSIVNSRQPITSFELFDHQTYEWKLVEGIKLEEAKWSFGYLNLK